MHIRIGFGVFLGETLAVMAYLGWTPRGPHRRMLWMMAAAWLILALASLWSASWIAERRWRATYSTSWTILSAFAVGGIAGLDSGVDSHLLLLLFLPVAYAALSFTPRATALCGLSAVVTAVVLTITDPDFGASQPDAATFFFFAILVGTFVLSVTASANRTRLERHRRWLLERIVELAEVDGLTGCLVGRVFRLRVDEEIARALRNDRPLSLMMIDVDKFKSVNDTFGHPAGDRVLGAVGAVLASNARKGDSVGRLGGDEFAVLMPDTDAAGAVALANRIRHDLPPSVDVPVTLTIGVSGLDRSWPDVEQILHEADLALYEVKRAGGDAVAVRHPALLPSPALLRSPTARS